MQRLMATHATSSPSEVTRVHQQRDAGITMTTLHRRSSSLSSSAAISTSSSSTSPKKCNGVTTAASADVSADLRRHSVGYMSLGDREDGSSPIHNGTVTAGHNDTAAGRQPRDVIADIPVTAQGYGVKTNGVTSYTPSHSRAQSLERNGLTYSHAGEDTRRRSLEIVSDVNGRRQGRGLRLVEGFVVGEGDRVLLALARSRSVDCSKASEGVGGYHSSPPPHLSAQGDDSGRQDSDGSPTMSSSSSHVMRLQLRQLGAKCDTLQRDLDRTKRELTCCLGNIRTFWSPELKKARAARHDEMTRNSNLAQQLLTCQDEVQRLKSLLEKLKTEFRTVRTDTGTNATVTSTKRTRGHIDTRSDTVSPRTHADTVSSSQRDKDTSDTSETRMLRKSVEELTARVSQLRDALSERDDTIGKLVTLLNNMGCMSSSSSSTRLDSAQNSDV